MTRTDRIFRARQIIIEHPGWGRRRINALLRTEFGRGLRDAAVDALTKRQREEREAGIRPVFVTPKPRASRLQRAMKRAGFLGFEIHGVRGSPAKGLGHIPPDSWHPSFRQVIERMIIDRWSEYRQFLRKADDVGWSRGKTLARWRRRVLKHYKTSIFPGIGRAVARGGRFIAADGLPSPWALYKAWETKLIDEAPFGGDGWGTPRPERRKRDYIARPVSKAAVKREIAQRKRWLEQLSVNIVRQRNIGNIKMVTQYEQQRRNLKATIGKLEAQLI